MTVLDLDRHRTYLHDELTKQEQLLGEYNRLLEELAVAADPDALDARASTCRAQTRVLAAIDTIERALERLDGGTYGRCEGCGQLIGEARLEALPATAVCIRCAAAGW